MADFFLPVAQDVLTFLLCAAVVVGCVLVLLLLLKFFLREHWSHKESGALSSVELNSLNDSLYDAQERALEVLDDKVALAVVRKTQSAAQDLPRKRLFVIDFRGDLQASQVDALADQINLVLLVGKQEDEVFLRLESPGGDADSYALAAEQLKRLRQSNVRLTASVDLIAASGGYMMAAVANHIMAAPEAAIGSIGVIMETPNIAELLQKIGISFHSLVSGPAKRPMPVFSPLTEEGKKLAEEELKKCFARFKQHVTSYRPNVDLAVVESGDVWPASEAVKLGLVDSIGLSDDFLLQRFREGWQIYGVEYTGFSPFSLWKLPFFSGLGFRRSSRT